MYQEMPREDLELLKTNAFARVKELEDAIKEHRSQKADDRCIEDDDRLYAVLGDGIKCDRSVGSKEEMLKNCARFIERRCEGGVWPTYEEIEKKLEASASLIEGMHQRMISWRAQANETARLLSDLRVSEERLQKKIDLLEDAVVIYRLQCNPATVQHPNGVR